MKSIARLSTDIEKELDIAEDYAKKAIEFSMDDPIVAKAYYNESVTHLNVVKNLHDAVVTVINKYKAEKGEPPAPMMAIYNYEHEKHAVKAAGIKNLQDLYK